MTKDIFSPEKELLELNNQLSLSRRLGFFLGAGISASLGLPDIGTLTKGVSNELKEKDKDKYDKLLEELKKSFPDSNPTVEDALNHLRLIRLLTKELKTKQFEGITGEDAKSLDKSICEKICKLITEKEEKADLLPVQRFLAWFNWLSRDFTKEIFTTNYDLVLERSLEYLQIPHFDGFVGGNEAFFYSEAVDDRHEKERVPLSWLRLWKLHGSFGWFWKKQSSNNHYKVVRLGINAKPSEDNTGELVIYPSREKYESSRKQPFLTYFDRLTNYLQNGEGLLLISGYSFMDQHINQIIFNSLKQNNRLHINAFLYNDDPISILKDQASAYLNLNAYSPKYGLIGGRLGEWDTKSKINEIAVLGDYPKLVDYLIEHSGKKNIIEEQIEKMK